MTAIKVPRSTPGEVLDDHARRLADLERRMRVRGDARLKLAADSPGSTLQAFLTANYPLASAGGLPLAVCDHGDNYPS